MQWKRRVRGTSAQVGKPFPTSKNGEIPEHTKQLKRATAKKWNEDNPERFQAAKRRWYLKKKLKKASQLKPEREE
jgi:hypothetical protein